MLGPIILNMAVKAKVIQIYSDRNISWVLQMALDKLRVLLDIILYERIGYKLISLIYKVLTTSQHDYIQNMISVQST